MLEYLKVTQDLEAYGISYHEVTCLFVKSSLDNYIQID